MPRAKTARALIQSSSTSSPGGSRETVNHPPHYNAHPSGVECITVVEWMNFNLGNAMKYIWRAGEKGNELEDLRKANWYLTREISRLQNGGNT